MSKTPITDKIEAENKHLPVKSQLYLMTNWARNAEQELAAVEREYRLFRIREGYEDGDLPNED